MKNHFLFSFFVLSFQTTVGEYCVKQNKTVTVLSRCATVSKCFLSISVLKELVVTSLQIAASPRITLSALLNIVCGIKQAIRMLWSWAVQVVNSAEMLFPSCALVQYHWTQLKNLILKKKTVSSSPLY